MNSTDYCGLENPIINIKLICIFAERINNTARVFPRPEDGFYVQHAAPVYALNFG